MYSEYASGSIAPLLICYLCAITSHGVKRVHIRSYYSELLKTSFSPNAGKFGKIADQNKSKYGLFLSSVSYKFRGQHFVSRIRTEYGEIRSICPYSVRMRENPGKIRTRIGPNTDFF